MVFVSKNLIRICKYCSNSVKENINFIQKNGKPRKKGYYRTCGSKECTKKQYKDLNVCKEKGRAKNPINHICVICGDAFKNISSNHKRFCIQCVPDKSWRGRAQRYYVGKPQWELLLKNQNNKCALCERNPEVIDHCHDSGKIRGLLCNACNVLIKFIDMPKEYIKNAFKYKRGNYSIQK